MTQNTQPPVKTFRVGTIEAAIWKSESQHDGRTVVRHTTRIQKRYQDKENNWQTTSYFFPEDLPKLNLVAEKAYEFVSLRESESVEANT